MVVVLEAEVGREGGRREGREGGRNGREGGREEGSGGVCVCVSCVHMLSNVSGAPA